MENHTSSYKKTGIVKPFISVKPLPEFSLWDKMKDKRKIISFDLEITARCNNNCRHCYINLPANDKEAVKKELSLETIKDLTNEAVSLGAIWCLITGGEPLLRKDFFDIYLYLKKKGLLVSVFTNASLITKVHIDFFKKYPPRDIEVTVYGVTKTTYERVTQRPGSFAEFMKGLQLLLDNNIKTRFKTMALRSNVHELPEIASFCRRITKDYYRFDPFLHLRFDGDKKKNDEIKKERLSPKDIVALEEKDTERFNALRKKCNELITNDYSHINCNHLFSCGAGNGVFTISYDGFFHLCSSLHHPDCIYDLKKGSLSDAWNNFVPIVRDMRSNRKEFLEGCKKCEHLDLCFWCPAHSYLETGKMDTPVDYFCEVAHARTESLHKINSNPQKISPLGNTSKIS